MILLRLALGFLTVLPARADSFQPGDLGRAAAWFPIIGFGLGAILAAAHFFFNQLFSPLLAAALTVALWAAITGGLHLDGLADCCDGLLASATRERRLEIMRDPRLGAFGAVGLFLFLALKILAVASLSNPPAIPFAVRWLPPLDLPLLPFTLAAVIGRWLILLVARQPPARPGGMGADFALGLTPVTIIVAALTPLALVVVGGARAFAAAALAHLVALGIVALARNRIGGVTGDVLGLTVEVAELVVLLVFAVSW